MTIQILTAKTKRQLTHKLNNAQKQLELIETGKVDTAAIDALCIAMGQLIEVNRTLVNHDDKAGLMDQIAKIVEYGFNVKVSGNLEYDYVVEILSSNDEIIFKQAGSGLEPMIDAAIKQAYQRILYLARIETL